MNKVLLRAILCLAILCVATAAAFAQGRGRGNGNGRRYDVFADRDYRYRGGRNQDWKCGKFVTVMTLAMVAGTAAAPDGTPAFGVTAFSTRAAQTWDIDGITRTITGGDAT